MGPEFLRVRADPFAEVGVQRSAVGTGPGVLVGCQFSCGLLDDEVAQRGPYVCGDPLENPPVQCGDFLCVVLVEELALVLDVQL